ncbi:MAG TPA: methyltransferase domain-containing protein [Pseudonocardia sp.]|nr:methyltransferase domain-containing protein [Pseudonocardia sp.]
MRFDEATSRRLAATYTTPDIVAQRAAIRAALNLLAGERVLDIGSGPGYLAREMAELVGPGGTVHGVDISENMLAIARTTGPAQGSPPGSAPVEFSAGEANTLPFPDGSFDVVTVTQVYEYVAEVAAALTEAHRVLRPGGRLLVLDTDWDSIVWRSGDPDRMRRVLTAWDQHLTDPYLPRRLTGLLTEAGFETTHRSVLPLLNAGYRADTYSAGLIGFISAFVPGRDGLTPAEVTAWADDLATLGADYFFSLNRYLFVATAQGA